MKEKDATPALRRVLVNCATQMSLGMDSEDRDSTDFPKVVREYSSGADSSCVGVHPFSAQSQQLGMGNSSLNTSIFEQLESLVTLPAISPDEMYSIMFAPVEEEMV